MEFIVGVDDESDRNGLQVGIFEFDDFAMSAKTNVRFWAALGGLEGWFTATHGSFTFDPIDPEDRTTTLGINIGPDNPAEMPKVLPVALCVRLPESVDDPGEWVECDYRCD